MVHEYVHTELDDTAGSPIAQDLLQISAMSTERS